MTLVDSSGGAAFPRDLAEWESGETLGRWVEEEVGLLEGLNPTAFQESASFPGGRIRALAGILAQEQARAGDRVNPLAAKAPHLPDKAKAKSVIFLFMAVTVFRLGLKRYESGSAIQVEV